MKTATRVMYLIGRIYTIIELVFGAILAVLGLVFLLAAAPIAESSTQYSDAAAVATLGITCLALGLVFLVLSIATLIVVGIASKKIKSGSREKLPHILILVFGAVSSNVFYFLGGLFGLIAA